jgi:hypothetical protein
MSKVKEIQKQEKEAVKEILLNEARLGFDLWEKGISYNKEEIAKLRIAKTGELPRSNGRGGSLSFKLPHGNSGSGHYTPWTPYSVVVEDNTPILYDENTRIGEITFPDAPNPLLNAKLSTGEIFRNIMGLTQHGGVNVGYSKECSLKDLGEDCLFCKINIGDGKYGERLNPILTPKIVAEAYDLARKAGVGNHFRISGGFVPERRELEYYIDVAEEIKKTYPDFYGAAIIGAPNDFSILAKYKEAGYSRISHNIEIWDKNIFAHICPGKDKRNGGWQHWIDSLEAAVDIFGRGKVHAHMIGGLEPKASTLEGVEYLASKGVVVTYGRFRPEEGTPLEGYRSPTADFHWDLVDKTTDIFIRYGFTMNELTGGPGSGFQGSNIFRIKIGDFERDKLTPWKYPALKIPA